MFLGGMKAEMRVTSDRLAKIEGMFTLVPRRQSNEVDQPLSLRLVYLVGMVPGLGIPANYQTSSSVHSE